MLSKNKNRVRFAEARRTSAFFTWITEEAYNSAGAYGTYYEQHYMYSAVERAAQREQMRRADHVY